MYVLFTDTDTDITPERAEHFGYKLISMPYTVGDKEIFPYVDFDKFDAHAFYQQLRDGAMPKTSGISIESYINYFEPYLKEGQDILYVHFSKAMTGTFNAMNIALEQLKEKYPDRTVYTIDTKAITTLSYNIVCAIGDLYLEGKSIEEIMKWAETEVDKYTIYFYADDLNFFRKSGRVTNFSAVMGNLLGIHPIIYMSSDGMMTSVGKCRGKKQTLQKIVDTVAELEDGLKEHRVIIGHTDAMEIAQTLSDMLKERFGQNLEIEFIDVNPTAGSHCGPDCVGVTFHAKHR